MDGTALYEAAAALFIAQMNGLHLKASDYIITRYSLHALFDHFKFV